MLKEILSVHSEQGLFKLVSQTAKMVIVESLKDGKRKPVFFDKKVISLADIAIYTDSEEVPLAVVLNTIKEQQSAQPLTIDPKSSSAVLYDWFATVLPEFDRDRVYPTDIKKIILWYNQLVEKGLTDFSIEDETDE